jgi:hypothetical protein
MIGIGVGFDYRRSDQPEEGFRFHLVEMPCEYHRYYGHHIAYVIPEQMDVYDSTELTFLTSWLKIYPKMLLTLASVSSRIKSMSTALGVRQSNLPSWTAAIQPAMCSSAATVSSPSSANRCMRSRLKETQSCLTLLNPCGVERLHIAD